MNLESVDPTQVEVEEDKKRIQAILASFPESGLFEDKAWLISPRAFRLEQKQVEYLEKLGDRLLTFQKACNLLYRQSVQGKAPSWIAEWLDLGKPQELIEIGRAPKTKNQIPYVIRPDLILTEEGFALSELDSVPGGIGLTAWLNQVYAQGGEKVMGGEKGMIEAAHRMLPQGPVVISEEASTYRPEMEWLFGKERIRAAESYQITEEPFYRFFEAFDWPILESIRNSLLEGNGGETQMTPPLKPYLEEKLWLALFWIKPLESFWRQQLGDRYFRELKQIIPRGWVVEPTPLPPTASLPELEVNSWEEVGNFSKKQRDLILKISGFSPLAWGARGVTLGSDVPTEEWKKSINHALESFQTSPYIMQKFMKGKRVEHPYWDEDSKEIKKLRGRVRLCPYYFVENEKAVLKGILATICPEDKKLLHGMKDAILVPVAQEPC